MLNKKKNFWQEYQYIFCAFLATSLTMFIIYACNTMVPFGDKTILRMDLYHQYGPLFAELYERVMSGDSLTYSWASGLGSCFLGNFFNYLSSPLTAIIFFFEHDNITEAIAAIILIKAALSASTFTFYLKRSQKSQNYASVAFGVMYAFCGYMLAYYWNIMWLDAMVLLPIVLLGIERIINNGKMATYVTGLALTMFSNYYMSYMICIFSVMYFIYYFAINYNFGSVVEENYKSKRQLFNNRFIRTGFTFAFASLCAAGLMAIVLLPVFGVLTSSSATDNPFPSDTQTYFKFFDFFANHFASLTTTIRSSGDDVLPNIYCGILTIILAPLFFFTKTISKKEKVATILLLVALYFSFNINIANYIWHGFHFPNDLPYRQSFVYSFVLLTMAYKTFLRLNEFSARTYGIVGTALVAFVFFVEKITSKNVTDGTIILTLVLLVLYVVILTIFKDKRYVSASVAFMLLICVCCEAIMCDTTAVHISVDKTPYVSDLDDFEEVKESLDTIEQGDFYRMELSNLRTRMDPSWYYYNGVSVFSSMASENVSNLQDDLGMMSNRINSYTYNPQTPVYNMMFSLKYILNNETPNVLNSPYYKSVIGNEVFEAYQNNYYLPIAYCVDSETKSWATEEYLEDWKNNKGNNPFTLQGDYFATASGTKSPFEKIEISYATYSNVNPFFEGLDTGVFRYEKSTKDIDGSAVFYLTTEKEGNVYIYFDDSNKSNSKNITINSSVGTMTHSASQACILDLGRYSVNETITVTIPFDTNTGTVTLYACTVNDKILDKGYSVLADNQMIIETFEDTYIKGKITPTEDSLLYTSIPYDKGWSVYIDGEQVNKDDIIVLGNALIAVNVEKGIHEVEFKFTPYGLKTGVVLSIFTAGLVAIYYLLKFLLSKKNKKLLACFTAIDNNFSEEIFYPEIEKETSKTVVETVEYVDISSFDKSRLKKEIISPENRVKKQIITPTVNEETNE